MNFPEQIFKAYDIRGVYPDELDESLVYKIARAFGQMRQNELGRIDTVFAVSRDMRLSSPALHGEVVRGLIEQGVDVVDLGLCSTPTFYYAVARYGYDGGLQVSASHNPAKYNGVKAVRERALPVGQGSGMETLMALTEVGDFTSNSLEQMVEKNGVLEDQVNYEMNFCGDREIGHFKIVADAANAMGAQYLDALFAKLPQVELIRMNFDLDGNFPAHEADPFKAENLVDLKKRVIEEKADLGIATDGDGDRIFFVDNLGKTVEPAVVRGIMAKIFLRTHRGATICYDIRPGKITEDMILAAGGVPNVTRVGHSLIKKQMIESGAVFGGESSGHFFVKFDHGIYEAPVVVIMKLLQELTIERKSLADYVAPLNKYFHSGEINFKVEDKIAVLSCLKEKYRDAKINDLDGLSFEYEDYWFNVRPSNTENLIRLNLESISEYIMKTRTEEISSLIKV